MFRGTSPHPGPLPRGERKPNHTTLLPRGERENHTAVGPGEERKSKNPLPRRGREGRVRGTMCPLAVFARGIVARVHGHLEEFLRIVLPELAHLRVGEDHGVLELAPHPLDLADIDVLDGIAPPVDGHRPAWEVL